MNNAATLVPEEVYEEDKLPDNSGISAGELCRRLHRSTKLNPRRQINAGHANQGAYMNSLLSLICAASLQWEANPPTDNVAKYVLYHSTNLVSGFSKLGETVETTFPLPSLASGEHFFFVTAVNRFGLESNPSNQIVAPVPYPPQGTRIVIVVE